MESEFAPLLELIYVYGFLNLAVRLILRQPAISASLAFWFGWWFLVSGASFTVEQGWRSISLYSAPYVESMFHGAFVGFLIGSIVGAFGKPKPKYYELVVLSGHLLRLYGRKVMISLFVIGSLFLAQRVATVGFSADYLSEVRGVYLERDNSMLNRLGSHLSVFLTTMIVLRGVYDSYHGVNIRALVLTILAGAPLGLANGARLFLMTYTLAYISSLLLCRSSFSRHPLALSVPEIGRFGGLIALLLLIFAFLGFMRGGYGDELNVLYAVIVWPVATLQAMDTWVFNAINSDRTYGLNTFGWLASIAARLGFINISEASSVMREVFQYFDDTHNNALFIPRSILPDLVFDFGEGAVFSSMAAMAFLLEWATLRYPGRGIFLHVLAVQSFLGSFMTIQYSVISPGFAVTVFWGAVLAYYVRSKNWDVIATKQLEGFDPEEHGR